MLIVHILIVVPANNIICLCVHVSVCVFSPSQSARSYLHYPTVMASTEIALGTLTTLFPQYTNSTLCSIGAGKPA